MIERTKEYMHVDAVQRTHENKYINTYGKPQELSGFSKLFCNKPDRLSIMFNVQFELQKRLGIFEKTKTSDIMMQHYVDKMLLAIHEEAVEIARETMSKDIDMPFGWKHCQGSERKYKEEIIDLWHFLMNLWLITGANDQDFFEMYLDKNSINHERQDSGY